MANRPPSDPTTRELMSEFRRKRERSRRLRIAALVGISVLVIGALTVASVSALSGGAPTTTTGVTSTSSATTVTTAGALATSSTAPGRPPTTRRPPPRPSTTTASGSATTATPTTQPVAASGGVAGAVVVVDPGHQARGNSALEPIGPGSSTAKDKVTSGTSGVSTGTPESKIALAIGLKLRDVLQARGIKVVMTRTSQDVDLSNIQRTKIANAAHAALYIRVHADGADSSSTHGIHTLYPATKTGWTVLSKRAAQLAQNALIAATGATDRGLDARSDMTGFNWSDVPVILPELGFMSNPEEDRLLNTASYQQKIAEALANAAVRFIQEQRGG
jgi:N-acetylmuramoyl-L-alanine amidase